MVPGGSPRFGIAYSNINTKALEGICGWSVRSVDLLA